MRYLLFMMSIAFVSCQEGKPSDQANSNARFVANDKFNEYWFSGEAEITSYELEQARYGEVHQGEAVTVFVTEPFSADKQVKLDNPSKAGKDKVDVLKLNLTKKFYTGVYPYSMMLSAFTPIKRSEFPNTLKTTGSSQEWCGHTFTQYNLGKTSYDITQLSYFESDGDIKTKLPKALLEDEIWSLIRINPELLPVGSFKINPGILFGRLRHTSFQQVSAVASLSEPDAQGIRTYDVKFDKPVRTLSIEFSDKFPHVIEGWTESYRSGFGSESEVLTTKATRKKRIKLDYWSRNSLSDVKYRELLELH